MLFAVLSSYIIAARLRLATKLAVGICVAPLLGLRFAAVPCVATRAHYKIVVFKFMA